MPSTAAVRRRDGGKAPTGHELSAKERLARKLNELIDASDLSQVDVARLLRMPQPKVSAIRNYKLRGISLQRLIQALTSLGQRVEIVVTPSSPPKMEPGLTSREAPH